ADEILAALARGERVVPIAPALADAIRKLEAEAGRQLTDVVREQRASATRVEHFECPRCERQSFHPKDVKEGYCGHCHDWTGRRESCDAARITPGPPGEQAPLTGTVV